MIHKEHLRELLSKPLPGEVAQWQMAPVSRLRLESSDYHKLKKAAVLVPLLERNTYLNLLLTLRSTYDGIHSAQVSFPGGKFEEGESEPFLVALREFEEELGIKENQVEVIGSLSPLVIPVSSMLVYPVVGWISEPFDYKPDAREVQKVIESPLYFFKKELVKRTTSIITNLKKPIEIPYFEIDKEKVWGATAMMISELMTIIESEMNY